MVADYWISWTSEGCEVDDGIYIVDGDFHDACEAALAMAREGGGRLTSIGAVIEIFPPPVIPHVGIFWSVTPVGGKPELLIDSVPVAAGADYGECVNHGAHADYWSKLAAMDDLALRERLLPTVARWTEYDCCPRGRVVYHRPTGRFSLYADRRLQTPVVVTDLMRRFGLPADRTDIRGDDHYE